MLFNNLGNVTPSLISFRSGKLIICVGGWGRWGGVLLPVLMRQIKSEHAVARVDVSERGNKVRIYYIQYILSVCLFSDIEYLIKHAVRNLKTQNHSLEWKQLGL